MPRCSARPPLLARTVCAIGLGSLLMACGADDVAPGAEPDPPEASTGEPGTDDAGAGDANASDGDTGSTGSQERPASEGDGTDGSDATSPEADDSASGSGDPAEPDLGVDVALREVHRMDAPTAGAVGPDGMLYLAERAGTVHAAADDGLGDPVVDVSSRTTADGERGLLGIVFSEDGTEFYASYTGPSGESVLAAYPVADGQIDGDAARTVMTVAQPYANHNGGHVAVGGDGLLYWGLGDGGGAGDPQGSGQDVTTPLGALLRIDPQGGDPYAVPADNPFVGSEGAAGEIWALGLRNPWRFSFDHVRGRLWIADVGQNSREEINRVPSDLAGANYGWNLMEGSVSFAGEPPEDHVPPVHDYDSTGSRCSITGGHVYRGDAIPELVGAYLFSDFCGGEIRAIVVDDGGAVVDEAALGVGGDSIVSFVEGPDDEVYVLDLDGRVSRLVPGP